MRFTMTSPDEKKMDVKDPVSYVVTESQSSEPSNKKMFVRSKYVIVAVTSVVMVTVVLSSILIGMYLFTEAHKDIVKFSMQLDKNTKQDVSSDRDSNVLEYHVTDPDQEVWIVNDYNIDVSAIKIQTNTQTACYLTPLNKTKDLELFHIEQIDAPPKNTDGVSLVYTAGAAPISDVSFLSKKARDSCKGVPVYWLYPSCEKPNMSNTTAPSTDGISKRQPIYSAWCSPCFYLQSYCNFYYYYYYHYYSQRYICVLVYHPCDVYYTRYC